MSIILETNPVRAERTSEMIEGYALRLMKRFCVLHLLVSTVSTTPTNGYIHLLHTVCVKQAKPSDILSWFLLSLGQT